MSRSILLLTCPFAPLILCLPTLHVSRSPSTQCAERMPLPLSLAPSVPLRWP